MSTPNVPSSSDSSPVPKNVRVHQHKAQLFRVVHAEGVWCSVNAYHNFNLIFYNERHPVPTSIYYALNEKGDVTREEVENREGKEGWFRELEVNVVLSLEAAKRVRNTLDYYINATEQALKIPPLQK